MDLTLLLDMAADGVAERVVLGDRASGLTASDLRRRAAGGAAVLRDLGASHLVYIAASGAAFPVSLFAASLAGIPFVPLNYRLSAGQLAALVAENEPAFVVGDRDVLDAIGAPEGRSTTPDGWLELAREHPGPATPMPNDPESVALLLYTSGTTAAPKAAVLRHRHLASYVLTTIDFAGAAPDDCGLVAVPPYHIAGVANTLTNLYAGRRVVHLGRFSPEDWLRTVEREGVTQALVVPTMLARIVEHLRETGERPPAGLRSLAYGGAPMPARVIEQALELFPGVDFTNAYGLTETSSTIAVLGPDDHRAAQAGTSPEARARLGSAGRLVPDLEARILGADGLPLPAGEIGLLYVRGPQVSGEYRGTAAVGSDDWFATRDLAHLDDEGYLFLHGRADDTIIRGGENVAPAEIEAVLEQHPAVAESAVVGIPDEEWGQRIAAVVVPHRGARPEPEELRTWVRTRLRGSKTPDVVRLVAALPRTDTGKILRRTLVHELGAVDVTIPRETTP
ncbi:acyl-CoA synthetase (AMP-forming)/AMP-acid ligase II [Actinocorallia herbida]|uniref:Acyl-CoA synthetase (AMP-forming)/AMP-acid ligase II n=1 Tax=Actinocorallia herbida TaxID=58109 RepID=A0A3N1D396_9ACTN|nr:AMP-binding protein [Actinocorallia herbida]ROO87995.1 acyl-CoA synthetase (AMP-forming)/AMP-acid ligase II [Actinocorallia herbida]